MGATRSHIGEVTYQNVTGGELPRFSSRYWCCRGGYWDKVGTIPKDVEGCCDDDGTKLFALSVVFIYQLGSAKG